MMNKIFELIEKILLGLYAFIMYKSKRDLEEKVKITGVVKKEREKYHKKAVKKAEKDILEAYKDIIGK